MKLIDRIDRKPVAVAFGLRRGSGGGETGDGEISVMRNPESVSLVTSAGATSLQAATPSVAGVLGATDKAKLDGIEAGATADQSGPEVVAKIDGHLGSTSWRQGGGVGSTTSLSVSLGADSVTVASDTGTDAVLPQASATKAGVMGATDKAKLDGIAPGAQVNPDAAAIKAAYEGNADTNAFTDAEQTKLQAIEVGAQKNPDAAAIKAAYEGNADTNAFTDAERAKLQAIEPGATGDQTGTELVAAIDLALGGAAWQTGGAGGTNLSFTRGASSVTVLSDTGGDAVLPSATASQAGVMSSADKTKLDGLGSDSQGGGDMTAAIYDPQGVAGDAFDRAKHTGVQAIGTITGLQTALESKALNVHEHTTNQIISGTLLHERGGLEADVSAYDGLVKISGGATSQAVPGTDFAAASHTHTQSQVTGLTSSDSPHFASVNLGHATDTTLARSAAGQVTIEGVAVLTASNTATVTNKSIDAAQLTGTVPVARFNGGTGASSSTFLRGDGTWATPAGGGSGTGNVTKVGTPVANRLAYWTGDGTLGHEAGFTYDPATDTLVVAKLTVGGVTFDGQNQLADPGADHLMGWDQSDGQTAYFAPTGGLEISGTNLQLTANQRTTAVQFVIDGGGAAITPGAKGFIQVPFACTITAARLLANQAGSIVIDVWKDTYANYPPVDADSITASAPLTISSAAKAENTSLTGWTTSVSAGDILGFHVDSASTITSVSVVLEVRVS